MTVAKDGRILSYVQGANAGGVAAQYSQLGGKEDHGTGCHRVWSAFFPAILDAMLSVIGTPSAIETESLSGSGEACPATKDTLEALSRKFTDGKIVSVTFRTESEGVRYGLILKPHYGGQDLSMWMGTVELTTEYWRRYWDALLRFDSLAFVCVGDEEGVELTDDTLTLASFPWDEWPTLAAALWAGDGGTGWVIKERTTARQSFS